jgi:Na+/phosphate symporter
VGIAAAHTAFNLLATALMLPFTGWLERLVTRLVPDKAMPSMPHEGADAGFSLPPECL